MNILKWILKQKWDGKVSPPNTWRPDPIPFDKSVSTTIPEKCSIIDFMEVRDFLISQGFEEDDFGTYTRKIEVTEVFDKEFFSHLSTENKLSVDEIKKILSYIKVKHYDYKDFIKTRQDEIKRKTKIRRRAY